MDLHPTADTAPLFRGAGVALLTLFDRDGALRTDETAAFAARLAADGADAILVAGTTGEFWTLSTDERLGLVAAVRHAVPATTPVIAGIGAADPAEALALANSITATGADAALCFVPPTEDPGSFLPKIRDTIGQLPLLAYHFPAVGYAPVDVAALAGLPVDGIKDSSGDPARLVATAHTLGRGVYTGSALLCSLARAVAADGAILALANAAPATAHEAASGSLAAQGELARLHGLIGGGTPPTALKAHVAETYGTPPFTRGVPLQLG